MVHNVVDLVWNMVLSYISNKEIETNTWSSITQTLIDTDESIWFRWTRASAASIKLIRPVRLFSLNIWFFERVLVLIMMVGVDEWWKTCQADHVRWCLFSCCLLWFCFRLHAEISLFGYQMRSHLIFENLNHCFI